MGTTCLLVIDVQQALIDEGPHNQAGFLNALENLLAAARNAGVLVAHVQHADEELVPGTPGWDFHPSVAPLDGEPVFGKRFSSAFKDTGLGDWLQEQGITDLVIVGMQTQFCLDATIKGAFERGYRITVPREGHTTFDGPGMTAPQIKAWYADQIWDHRFATVVPIEEILSVLV